MRIVKLHILCFLLSLCTSALAQSLQLSISTPSSTVKSGGAQVVILVKLTNGTDRVLNVRQQVGDIIPGFAYKVLVTRADGRVVPSSSYAKDIQSGVPGSRSIRTLSPGESLVEKLNISRLVDMTSPGLYHIVLTRERSEADQSTLTSNVVSIQVGQ